MWQWDQDNASQIVKVYVLIDYPWSSLATSSATNSAPGAQREGAGEGEGEWEGEQRGLEMEEDWRVLKGFVLIPPRRTYVMFFSQ